MRGDTEVIENGAHASGALGSELLIRSLLNRSLIEPAVTSLRHRICTLVRALRYALNVHRFGRPGLVHPHRVALTHEPQSACTRCQCAFAFRLAPNRWHTLIEPVCPPRSRRRAPSLGRPLARRLDPLRSAPALGQAPTRESRNGRDSTHCRTGTLGITRSTRCAASLHINPTA